MDSCLRDSALLNSMTFRSAGVAPEVNLMNPLHASKKTCKQGILPGFEIQGKHHQKFKQRISMAPQNRLMSSKNVLKIQLSCCQGMNSNLNGTLCVQYQDGHRALT